MKPTLCLGIENGIWHSNSPSCMCFLNLGVLNLLDRSDCLHRQVQDLWWLVDVDVDVFLSWIKLLWLLNAQFVLNLVIFLCFSCCFPFFICYLSNTLYLILWLDKLGLSNAKLNVHHKIKSLRSELSYLN